MKTILPVILIFSSLCVHSQIDSNDLIGTWECYHMELKDGTTTLTDLYGNEEKISCEGTIIRYNKDLTGLSFEDKREFKYQLNDSILVMYDHQYLIEELTKTNLIVIDNFLQIRWKLRKLK